MEGTDHCTCSLENAFTLPTDWGWGAAAKCGLVCRHLFGCFHRAGNCFNSVTALFCWFLWIVGSRLCWPPLNICINSKITLRMCCMLVVVTFQWVDIFFDANSAFLRERSTTLWLPDVLFCLIVLVSNPAIRACLIPQIPPGVLHQGQPAESYLPPMPASHAGCWALICLPGTEPTIGGLGRVCYDHVFIIH